MWSPVGPKNGKKVTYVRSIVGLEGPLTWKGDVIYYFWRQILSDSVSFTLCNNLQQYIFTQFWDI